MARIYTHKNRGFQVRFFLYFPDGSSIERYRYFPTKSEAETVKRNCEFLESGSRSGNLSHREVILARHDGLINEEEARLLTGGKLAVDYDLDRIMEAHRVTIAISHTPVAYEKAYAKAKLIAGWLASHPIPYLTDSDVKGYVLDRREGRLKFVNAKTKFARVGVRDKTISNEIQIMCGIIDEAVKLKMVEINVARLVSVPVKSSKVRRSLTLLEISALLKAADANHHLMHGQVREFILFALFTGWRRSELRTITWDDINFESKKLIVQSKLIDGEDEFNAKAGVARSMTIPDKLMPIIEGMERKGRFLFGGDAPRDIDSISQVVKLVMRRAGIEGVSLHTCRHTFGSWILRKTGGDLKATQELLGHLDINTTALYMHNILDGNDPSRSLSYE